MVTLCLANFSIIDSLEKKKEQTRDHGEKRCYILYGLGFFEIPFTMNDILENAIIWDNE